jgi:hypothetical protein
MSSDWSFPPVPTELKTLAPYFQRAQELRVKDAVMSYWCSYQSFHLHIPSLSRIPRHVLCCPTGHIFKSSKDGFPTLSIPDLEHTRAGAFFILPFYACKIRS